MYSYSQALEGLISLKGNMLKVKDITWVKHSKRILYTDNVLRHSGPLF